MRVGERIKRARIENGLTQDELAIHIKTTKQTVHKYENGIITNIPSSKIEAIAEVLNTTPAYLMGWDDDYPLNPPDISTDNIEFPVIGEVATGFDKYANEDWNGDKISIPASYLKSKSKDEFFVLRVKGDSMYPMYLDGDKVLVHRQTFVDYSGQVAVVIYGDDCGTIKKVEHIKDGIKLVPINPMYQAEVITGYDTEQVFILGVPKLLVREIDESIIKL